MIAIDLQQYLQASAGVSTDSIFPHVMHADHKGSAILYKQESSRFTYSFNGDDDLISSVVELVILDKRFDVAVALAQEVELVLRDFKGTFVTGSHSVERTQFLNEYTAFDADIERYVVVFELDITYNR